MTRTIKSNTTNVHYFLTIGEDGLAHDCSCPDQYYRCYVAGNTDHECKHIRHYNEAFILALAVVDLKTRYDVRGQVAVETRRAAYWQYEMMIAS